MNLEDQYKKMKFSFLGFIPKKEKRFDFAAERDTYLPRIRAMFLVGYTVLSIITYVIIITGFIHGEHPILAYSFAALIAVLITNLILYRATKRLTMAGHVLLAVILIVIIIGMYEEHFFLGGALWIMPFPMYIFFLHDFRNSIRWLIGTAALMLVLTVTTADAIVFVNSPVNYLAVFIMLALGISLTLFFIDRYQSDISKYQLIAKYSRDFILFWDNNFNIMYASPSAVNYLGIEPDELIGKNFLDFIHENDRHRIEAYEKRTRPMIEFRLRAMDKQSIWIEGSFEIVFGAGKKRSVTLMTARDITRRRNYEKQIQQAYNDTKKFKQAVDNTSEHVIITDINGIVQYANPSVTRITGYEPEEVVGKKAGALWGGHMDKDFYDRLWNTIKDKKQTFRGRVQNQRKNKEMYYAYVSISPLRDKNSELVGFIGIERDVTQEVRVDRAKTEFVSLASHQLRTPLSAIGWYTEMLLNGDAGKLTKDQKEYLQEVYAGNKRMVDLVNALLNVSRLELGTFIVEPEPTDIVNLAKGVVKELQPKIKAKNLSIEEKYGTLPEISADPKLLRIVFQNLLSNAVKYTPAKGTITIAVSRTQKSRQIAGHQVPKDMALISVKDTGMGIPTSQQTNIFTKLFRADNVKESDTEGTGLGLYIVRSILDQSGGKIWFVSKENKGTTFYAIIPLSGMKKKKGTKALN